MAELAREVTDRNSTFRTEHEFEAYAEFTTPEEFAGLVRAAKESGRRVVILGNGSNMLFRRRRVHTAVLRNKLEREMEDLGDGRVRASSSLMISAVLKHCRSKGLDSFYYLASVPATVGGALAMNAGRGREHNKSIYDFVESVTWFDGGEVRSAAADEIEREYRWTPFTGLQEKLILGATFRFPPTEDGDDKIVERVQYSKEWQDHSAGNCGSVFKKADFRIMRRIRGLRIGTARFSPKTANWLLSTGRSARPLVLLIRVAKALHVLTARRAVLELIEVD